MASFYWPPQGSSGSTTPTLANSATGNHGFAQTPSTSGSWANPSGGSITLTKGIWMLSGMAMFQASGAVMTGSVGVAIDDTNTGSGFAGLSQMQQLPPTSSSYSSCTIAPFVVSLAATGTYYLNILATYSAGHPTVSWSILAVQIG